MRLQVTKVSEIPPSFKREWTDYEEIEDEDSLHCCGYEHRLNQAALKYLRDELLPQFTSLDSPEDKINLEFRWSYEGDLSINLIHRRLETDEEFIKRFNWDVKYSDTLMEECAKHNGIELDFIE